MGRAKRELDTLYCQIGPDILVWKRTEGRWRRTARAALKAVPDMRGFSTGNLNYMPELVQALLKPESVQEPVAQLSWSHVVTPLYKTDDAPPANSGMPA